MSKTSARLLLYLPSYLKQGYYQTYELEQLRLWLSLIGFILVIMVVASWIKIVKKSKNWPSLKDFKVLKNQ